MLRGNGFVRSHTGAHREDKAAYLLVAVRGPDHARRLAASAPDATLGEQLVYLGSDVHLRELRAVGAQVLACPGGPADLPTPLQLARHLRDALSADTAQAA